MFHSQRVKVVAVQLLAFITLLPDYGQSLIITSVLAGDKKFKTVSFHTKLLKPMTFEKEMPLTEFRRHRTLKPPKFDIDINIPIKLPLEEEYPKEEPYKPVENNFFFQSGHDVSEPSYTETKSQKNYSPKKVVYKDDVYAASSNNNKLLSRPNSRIQPPAHLQQIESRIKRNSADPEPVDQHQSGYGDNNVGNQQSNEDSMRAEHTKDSQEPQQQQHLQQQVIIAQEASENDYSTSRKGYDQNYQNNGDYAPEFIPGGYVNLQFSGPVGGPKPTYEDYDREKWAQQLSQAPGAMPYPILNYQQLQNFYGGLGTFTNGLAENRYEPLGLLEKLKSGISHFANKFHLGFSH